MSETDLPHREDKSRKDSNKFYTKIRSLWTRPASEQFSGLPASDGTPLAKPSVDGHFVAERKPYSDFPSAAENGDFGPISVDRQTGRSSIGSHTTDRYERKKALFAKYGIDIPEADYPVTTREPVERVPRSIRMRIRYWCHQCNTLYGSTRDCSQCAHRRCNQCVRHPPKRPAPRLRIADAARTRNASSIENLPSGSRIVLHGDQSQPESPIEPTFTPPVRLAHGRNTQLHDRTAGMTRQDEPFPGARLRQEVPNTRVTKDHRVRIHYTCHHCQRVFSNGEHVCASCEHERCEECPRNPPRVRRRQEAPKSDTKDKRVERMIPFSGSESDDTGPGAESIIAEHLPGTTDGVVVIDTAMS